MIKTKQQLERNLGKKLRNGLSIGVDLASTTGLCFIDNTKQLKISFDIFKLPKIDNPKENIPIILKSLVDFTKELENKIKTLKAKPMILIIEKCYIGKNAHTALILSAFAGVVYSILYPYFDEIYFIHPMTSRKNIGLCITPKLSRKERKQKVVEFVNNILNDKIESDDKCDAFVYAINGLIK